MCPTRHAQNCKIESLEKVSFLTIKMHLTATWRKREKEMYEIKLSNLI